MKRLVSILFLISVALACDAQLYFRTLTTSNVVTEGESFRIQYLVEDRDGTEFAPPDFAGFRVVSKLVNEGTVEIGGEVKKLKNIGYTLEAEKAGQYTIQSAKVKLEGFYVAGEPVNITVITKEQANKRSMQEKLRKSTEAAYYLQPGEDPYRKIKTNLFLKVLVDKRTCFVGEPITATFKLYSRLVSRSDIIKNPGFYGFTVQDMIGLNDNLSTIETVNGKKFDVHTIRKVQLYPLRAGQYSVDPMEIVTKVDFSRSAVTKRTEQEITEGVYDSPPEDNRKNVETFESHMSSDPIMINVTASPAKSKPNDFTGATGQFLIEASIDKDQLKKNEEGTLTITVSGKGNFTQLSPPTVAWPKAIEGFEAQVNDKFSHDQSPLKGSRTFRFPFVSSKSGKYTLPSISFSFFDPDSNRYKTVSTKAVDVTVTEEDNVTSGQGTIVKKEGGLNYLLIGAVALAILALAAGLFIRRRKAMVKQETTAVSTALPSVDTIMEPARIAIGIDDRTFYMQLRQCIWNCFSIYFGLKGSDMNRQRLQTVMREANVDTGKSQSILEILEQCEIGLFADANVSEEPAELLAKVTRLLKEIINKL